MSFVPPISTPQISTLPQTQNSPPSSVPDLDQYCPAVSSVVNLLPAPSKFQLVDQPPQNKLLRLPKTRAIILYKPTNSRRRKRRSEAELLKLNWAELYYFRHLRHEPLPEDYGSASTGYRRSRRIAERLRIAAT